METASRLRDRHSQSYQISVHSAEAGGQRNLKTENNKTEFFVSSFYCLIPENGKTGMNDLYYLINWLKIRF